MVLICLAMALSSLRARADDTADEAQLHFELGIDCARRNDFRCALEHFLASNRLAPNKNVVFNIAQAFEALGHFPDAFRYYTSAFDAERDPAARQPIEDSIQRISSKVALLNVVTEPSGATLYLTRRDLGARGTSPRLLGLPAGRYTVIAELDGYHPAETTADPIEIGKRVDVVLRLKRILGTVRVEGATGAAVRADSESAEALCSVPCEAQLPPGHHTMLISKEGYQTAAAPVEVLANTTSIVRPMLTSLLGTIVVSSDTPGATISVDGTVLGFTPAVLTVAVGHHHVIVRQPGFKDLEQDVDVAINSQANIAAQFAPVESALDLSVEAASRTSEKQSRAPAITTVWTAHDIATTPARTLEDVLKLLPGIDTFDLPDEGRHLVGVRGVTTGSVLVLVDGQRLNTSVESPVDLDLPLENIERIELIRGPGSTLYGTYAFNGVLNIVTRKPVETRGLVVRYRYGARGVDSHMSTREERVTVSAGRTLGPLAVGGFLLFSEDQGPRQQIQADAETVRRQNLLRNYPGLVGCSVATPTCTPLAVPAVSAPGFTREWARKVELDLNADYGSALRYNGKLYLTQKEPIVGRGYTLNDATLLNRTRVLQSLEFQHSFDHAASNFPTTKLDARYFFDFHRWQDYYQDEPAGWDLGESTTFSKTPETFPVGKVQQVSLDYVSNLLELKADQAVRLRTRGAQPPDLLLTVGGALEEQQITSAQSYANYGPVYKGDFLATQQYQSLKHLYPSQLFWPGGRQTIASSYTPDNFLPSRFIAAAFAQARWDATSWLTATAGARFDNYSDFGGAVSPRAGLIIAPSEALFFKLLYGHAFNAPSFTELYLATPEQTTSAGNANLRPEQIDTYEVQVGWQKSRFRATANAYVFRINDLIRPVTVIKPFTGPASSYDNLNGVATGYGGELETRIIFSDSFNMFATGSVQQIAYNVTTTAEFDIPPSVQEVILPTLKGTCGANWEAVKNVTFSATLIGANARSQASSFPAGSTFTETSSAPAYGLLNAAVLVDKIFDRAYAKVMVMNAVNSDHRDYVLSLPYNLPRAGTELYVEAGVHAF